MDHNYSQVVCEAFTATAIGMSLDLALAQSLSASIMSFSQSLWCYALTIDVAKLKTASPFAIGFILHHPRPQIRSIAAPGRICATSHRIV